MPEYARLRARYEAEVIRHGYASPFGVLLAGLAIAVAIVSAPLVAAWLFLPEPDWPEWSGFLLGLAAVAVMVGLWLLIASALEEWRERRFKRRVMPLAAAMLRALEEESAEEVEADG